MLLIHAKVLGEDFRFDRLDLEIEEGRILRVGKDLPYAPEDTVIDCEGYTIVPGLVDIHIHGCAGSDTCDGTREAMDAMGQYLLAHGVTSFCPTTMTVDVETIDRALEAARACAEVLLKGGAAHVSVLTATIAVFGSKRKTGR